MDATWSGNESGITSLKANIGGTTFNVNFNPYAGTVTVSGRGQSTTMSAFGFYAVISKAGLSTTTTHQTNGVRSKNLRKIAG